MENIFEGIIETAQTITIKEIFADTIRVQDVIKKHIKLIPITLPYYAEDKNRILRVFELPCEHCGYQLIDMRGTIIEQFGTITIDSEGYCINCNALTTSLMRWHEEGHWTGKINGEWFQIIPDFPKTSLWKKIKKLFKGYNDN